MTDASTLALTSLLQAVDELLPTHDVVTVAGIALSELPTSSRTLVPFGDGAHPGDSASAIVALERSRAMGAEVLVLPAPANEWLNKLGLFRDHCRQRYSSVVESELGAVFDLRRAAHPSHPAAGVTAEGGDRGDEWGEVAAEGPSDATDGLADALSRIVHGGSYTSAEFRAFERRGVHVTPVHFYSPIPDTAQLSEGTWERDSDLVGIDMNDDGQLRLLSDVFPQFRAEYEALPTVPCDDGTRFYLGNGLFDGTDALVLYCMLRYLQPQRVIEVGSGFSTRLAAQAALENGSTEIVCVEPYPDSILQQGFRGLTELIQSRVEELPLDFFSGLRANDVLFIDSSHVARVGSDVNFLFLEVLPRLSPGVAVHVHDVFLPLEYRRDWVLEGLRFWNEQYLLQAFLTFNSRFSVLMANSYLQARHPNALRTAFPTSPWWGGGSFWMQRRTGV